MTTERKKALITIITTLVIGILIGALAVGLWSKRNHNGRSGRHQNKRETFVKKIFSVIDADSSQAKQLRPLINETITQIDSLQKQTDKEVTKVIDSFENKLRPILSEKQMQKLKEFHSKVRERK